MKNPRHDLRIFGAVIVVCFLGSIAAVALASPPDQVVKITAKRFEYNPNEIKLKKGVPAVLEFTSLDRLHGFSCPDFGIRIDIVPGKVNTVRFVPDKTGTFAFQCDIFCGDGHEDMTGKFIVEE